VVLVGVVPLKQATINGAPGFSLQNNPPQGPFPVNQKQKGAVYRLSVEITHSHKLEIPRFGLRHDFPIRAKETLDNGISQRVELGVTSEERACRDLSRFADHFDHCGIVQIRGIRKEIRVTTSVRTVRKSRLGGEDRS
jgi:hypothetical protein